MLSKKTIPYIYILFFSCFSYGIVGQNLELKISAVDTTQTPILNQIKFNTNHKLEATLYKEITSIQNTLKKEGYFITTIDTILVKDEKYEAVFNLGKKTNEIIIINKLKPEERTQLYGAPKISKSAIDSIHIKTNEFDEFTNQLLEQIDKRGKSFSEITYVNPILKNDTLIIELTFSDSKNRTIDKVTVKGYEEFPKKFIRQLFKIEAETVFSKRKMKEISTLTKSLDFIKEKRAPEVLFKKD